MLIHRVAALLLALAFITPLAAASNFPGWQRTYEAKSVTVLSPQDQHGAVSLVLGVAEVENGDPKAAFSKEIDEVVASLGGDMRLTNRSGVRIENGVLIETLRVRVDNTADIDVLLFAYHTGSKIYQAGMLGYPSAVPDADPRVNHALDFIATAVRTKYRLTDARAFDRTAPAAQQVTAYTNTQAAPTSPPVSSAPAPQPQPQQSGKKCERRPVWGFRVSYWCQPSGICPDRVIKDYETVCE